VAGWREFEDVCTEILTQVLVPPLTRPRLQNRTDSGLDRRDAVFPNRNFSAGNFWGNILHRYGARFVLADFKNYDREEIGQVEVDQLRNYLNPAVGRFGLLVCNKIPDDSAHRRRLTAYQDDDKLILFLVKNHLKELLYAKERGADPTDLIVDLEEDFYLRYG